MRVQGACLKVMVVTGGPDRERAISLQSAGEVAAALRQAGHEVRQCEVAADNLTALDEFLHWGGHVVFPALHGPWGEGGALQRAIDQRGLPYVGSTAPASACCMDKNRAKLLLAEHRLPSPPYQIITNGQEITLEPPVVLKPPCEGSSIDLLICQDDARVRAARIELQSRHKRLMIEQFVAGKELTVGVLDGPNGNEALPPIHIIPATSFYDYEAKYERHDTQYLFNIDLPPKQLDRVVQLALKAHAVLGCRHLSRVDFIVDEANHPWILEVNTIPGFTRHSLVPMAAAHVGITMPALVDRLVRMAADG